MQEMCSVVTSGRPGAAGLNIIGDKMNKENVFRVQNSQRRGPWIPGFSEKWVIQRKAHDKLNPTYIDFPGIRDILIPGVQYGTGCHSLKILRKWFSKKEYKMLLEFGFNCVMFKAEVILQSDTQVVFIFPDEQAARKVKLY